MTMVLSILWTTLDLITNKNYRTASASAGLLIVLLSMRVIQADINMDIEKRIMEQDEYGNTLMFEDDPDAAVYRRIVWAIAGLYIWIPFCILGLARWIG